MNKKNLLRNGEGFFYVQFVIDKLADLLLKKSYLLLLANKKTFP